MQASGTLDELELAVLIERAEQYASQQDFTSAHTCYDAALTTLRRDCQDHPVLVRALAGFAWTLQGLDDCEAALRLHEEALAAQLRMSGDAQAAICAIRRGIGSALGALGRLDEAQEQYRAVLAAQRDLLDSHDPELAATLNIMGETAARLECHEEARRYQEEALAILRALHPPGAPEIAVALTNLGVSLYRLDAQQAAETCLREALQIDPNLLLAAENLIHVLYQQVRKVEGRALAAEKYRRQSFVVQPAPARPTGTLLVPWSLDGNIPKHHLLARLPMIAVDWHIQYADDGHERQLPPYDLVFNLIGDADQGAAAPQRAVTFRDRCVAKLLNDPVRVQRTRRKRTRGSLRRSWRIWTTRARCLASVPSRCWRPSLGGWTLTIAVSTSPCCLTGACCCSRRTQRCRFIRKPRTARRPARTPTSPVSSPRSTSL
ncbi:MAG TPA: tetratricopeptide repeat protein [Acetobacteraceae bacterium]